MTVQQRLDIYRELLERISNIQDQVICICGTLNLMYAERARKLEWKSIPDLITKIEEYPELLALKPKDLSGIYWWPMRESTPRIECLKQAIISCENQILKENTLNIP